MTDRSKIAGAIVGILVLGFFLWLPFHSDRGPFIAWAEICIVAVFSMGLGLLFLNGQAKALEREADKTEVRDSCVIAGVVWLALCGGVFSQYGILAYVDGPKRTYSLLLLTSWSFGIFMAGFLLGFLFGIPRVLQRTDSPSRNGEGYRQQVNTNLEQISDWLTKIIVGLGLVQLRLVPAQLAHYSKWIAASLPLSQGQGDHASSYATATIISFSILGFLAGYLGTRLFLARAFWRADRQEPRGPLSKESIATRFDDDADTVAKIEAWVMPAGEVDPVKEKLLVTWLRDNGLPDVSWAGFLHASEYASKRKEAVVGLNIA